MDFEGPQGVNGPPGPPGPPGEPGSGGNGALTGPDPGTIAEMKGEKGMKGDRVSYYWIIEVDLFLSITYINAA